MADLDKLSGLGFLAEEIIDLMKAGLNSFSEVLETLNE